MVSGPGWRAVLPLSWGTLVIAAPEVVALDRRDNLLRPLIGKPGIGQIGFAAGESRRLTGVELRPNGLVRPERATWMNRP
jgi:hypothetical protein